MADELLRKLSVKEHAAPPSVEQAPLHRGSSAEAVLSQGFVRVPQVYIGLVVGRNHSRLKEIEKQTGAIIKPPWRATGPMQTHSIFSVFGTPEQIAAARHLIERVIARCDAAKVATWC